MVAQTNDRIEEGDRPEQVENKQPLTPQQLIDYLIQQKALTDEDLNNPKIIEFLSKARTLNIFFVEEGDNVYYIDLAYPKQSFIKGVVVYKGQFETLGYNDTSVISETGIRIRGKRVLSGVLGGLFDQQIDVIHMNNFEPNKFPDNLPFDQYLFSIDETDEAEDILQEA